MLHNCWVFFSLFSNLNNPLQFDKTTILNAKKWKVSAVLLINVFQAPFVLKVYFQLNIRDSPQIFGVPGPILAYWLIWACACVTTAKLYRCEAMCEYLVHLTFLANPAWNNKMQVIIVINAWYTFYLCFSNQTVELL